MENQEEKKEAVVKANQNENFFKSLFTTYLPIALASIGLVLFFLVRLLVVCGAVGAGLNWIAFFGWVTICVGVFFAIVKMVLKKKLEFDIQLISTLLILIACSMF